MKKILVIEDNTGVAELISARLVDFGYETQIATSGIKAIEFLEQQGIDMVILDYSLPDMDGKEIITSVLKANIKMPPFIVSTGRGDEQLAVDMMKLGAYDYLIKDKTLISRLPEVVAKLDHEIERDNELMKAQLALKKSEERFRNFVEKSSDFFVKLSPRGLIIYFSPNWQHHLGYTFEELSLKEIYLLIYPDDLEKMKTDIRNAIKAEGNQFATEYRILDGKGDWKYHFVKGYSVSENGKLFVNCIARDITDRKLAGKKLARAVFLAEEKEKKLFAEQLHEGIGPLISAIKLSMGRIKSLKNIDEKGLSIIEYSDKLVDDAVTQVRNLANDLLPNIINDFGLVSAVKSHVEKLDNAGKRPISFIADDKMSNPDSMTSIIIYRALTELTSNSFKYASDAPIEIEMATKDNTLFIIYIDHDFRQQFGDEKPDGEINVGLENMKNKIESLDGSVSYQTFDRAKTQVDIVVNLHR